MLTRLRLSAPALPRSGAETARPAASPVAAGRAPLPDLYGRARALTFGMALALVAVTVAGFDRAAVTAVAALGLMASLITVAEAIRGGDR